jgi:dephospho-CoA kinase
MGKSTTAKMFRDLGVPVWDADATVHRLYAKGGAAVQPVADLVPGSEQHGTIDRTVLKAAIKADPTLLKKLENLVHPLVAADRAEFISRHRDAPLVVLDIPLLYETGGDGHVDRVAVVSTSPAAQRARVLARPGMTPETFEDLLSRQVPDDEKRRKADYLIPTDTIQGARAAVSRLVLQLTGGTDA